jgi:hypothetical protein
MAGDVDMNMREKLMRALLEGQNNSEAARSSGYSRKHVKELVKQPAFARELDRRRAAMPVQAPGEVDPDEEKALQACREIVDDAEQPGTARVAAAKALFDRVDKRKAPVKASTQTHDKTEVAAPGRKQTAAEYAAKHGIKLA